MLIYVLLLVQISTLYHCLMNSAQNTGTFIVEFMNSTVAEDYLDLLLVSSREVSDCICIDMYLKGPGA